MILETAVLLFVAQIQVPVRQSVTSIEDIQIGMTADLVIAGLTKQGYTLTDGFAGTAAAGKIWNVSRNREMGSFDVEQGRVTRAEKLVYDNHGPATRDGAIELAEALYWALYDNGTPLASEKRDWKETEATAFLTTREFETRDPGTSVRMILLRTNNGARYRISFFRRADQPPAVYIYMTAPFVKKK